MLSVQGLSIILGKRQLFQGLSFEVPRGSIACITGKSGIGKSTLLECIAQLRETYSGIIAIEGKDLKGILASDRASLVGLVFQQFNLFPHLTVLENCTQPLIVTQKMDKKRAYERALSVLESLGMGDYLDAFPIRLSGGQQQRVALARALSLKPQLLCLDEPTSALDAENTQALITLLKEISSTGTTILCTSHDKSFVTELDAQVISLGS